MPDVRRKDWEVSDGSPSPNRSSDAGYRAGGDVGTLQADLARRIASQQVWVEVQPDVAATERVVRFISVAGGYGSLAVGFVSVIAFIVYCI